MNINTFVFPTLVSNDQSGGPSDGDEHACCSCHADFSKTLKKAIRKLSTVPQEKTSDSDLSKALQSLFTFLCIVSMLIGT